MPPAILLPALLAALPAAAGRAHRVRFYIRNAALHSLRYASNSFGMKR